MSLLPIHIIAGSIAIIAGFISVFAVKGPAASKGRDGLCLFHGGPGALTGAVIAVVKNQPPNIIGGALAFIW